MPKLNQIVAVVAGKKTRVEKEFGELNKVLQKGDLFHGIARQYQPVEEGGEELPSERKDPQRSARAIMAQARLILTDIINAVATQEYGNCTARADVKVGDLVVLSQVPVTVLLYLSKQLDDLHTFVNNVPLLDPSERWTFNAQDGQYVTEEIRTVRTRKVQKPIVLYDATDKHPAQTQADHRGRDGRPLADPQVRHGVGRDRAAADHRPDRETSGRREERPRGGQQHPGRRPVHRLGGAGVRLRGVTATGGSLEN